MTLKLFADRSFGMGNSDSKKASGTTNTALVASKGLVQTNNAGSSSNQPITVSVGGSDVNSNSLSVVDSKASRVVNVILIGAGNRGTVYSNYGLDFPSKMKVVAVADPRPAKVRQQQSSKSHTRSILIA